MSAGRDQWILFCLDDFMKEPLHKYSALLQKLVESDFTVRETMLDKATSREKESLYKEVSALEKKLRLA